MLFKKRHHKFVLPKYLSFGIMISLFVVAFFLYFKSGIPDPEKLSQYPQKKGAISTSSENFFGFEDRERFPSITDPKYVEAIKANEYLHNNDGVYTFVFKGNRYVYPVSILGFHHIINDTLGNNPVAITLCLLTNSATVYSRSIEGNVLTFGVLGILYNGNLVMFDDKTNSYWIQLTGDSIFGSTSGKRLNTYLPMEFTYWEKIKGQPNLKVLYPKREMKFYRDFFETSMASGLGLHALGNKKVDNRFSPYTLGIGIEVQNERKFYELEKIFNERFIEDSVGGWSLLLVHDEKLGIVKMFRRYIDGLELTFKKEKEHIVDEQTGSVWDMDGFAISGLLKGKQLEKPNYTQVYWFAWYAFFPETMSY